MRTALLLATAIALTSTSRSAEPPEQVPSWSAGDLEFFLHGSMSTEAVPETVLTAFIRTYPDLFPTTDLSHLGLVPDPGFGWPIGFTRSQPAHLGGLPSIGINCASCHVAEIATSGGAPVRIFGTTGFFDAEAYFGALFVATLRTAEPANMRRFLAAYLAVTDPPAGDAGRDQLLAAWEKAAPQITETMKADPFGNKGAPTGGLHPIDGNALRLDRARLAADPHLPELTHQMLRLFHNMRAGLHLPDAVPDKAPPSSGPGRNDAFGLLSQGLLGMPRPYAPVKYGLVWNLEQRHWVHWDGNTESPLGRNILAVLGLGAPLVGTHGQFDFALVQRHTDLTERIRAPRYPWAIDREAASRGAAHYQANCASCHSGPETDSRLFAASAIGTDAMRATAFAALSAQGFNRFLASFESPGYTPPKTPGLRSTGKYWSPTLAGVWARSPYLHNGSVRTMEELLTKAANRAPSFHRGSRTFDPVAMGWTDEGYYLLDVLTPGNANTGHDYGTGLSPAEKHELIEFLKTL